MKFYTINDVSKMTKLSIAETVDLFFDPEFPKCDYGKTLIVEENALINFFSKPRLKKNKKHNTKDFLIRIVHMLIVKFLRIPRKTAESKHNMR